MAYQSTILDVRLDSGEQPCRSNRDPANRRSAATSQSWYTRADHRSRRLRLHSARLARVLSVSALLISVLRASPSSGQPISGDFTRTLPKDAGPTNVNVQNFPPIQIVTSPAGTDAGAIVIPTPVTVVPGDGGLFPVTGSISVSNFPATQPVSGTITVITPTPVTVVPGDAGNFPITWAGPLTGGSANTVPVGGNQGQNASISGNNAILHAGQSQATGTLATTVGGSGRVSTITTDLDGHQFVIIGSSRPWYCNITSTPGATVSTLCTAALDGGLYNYMSSVITESNIDDGGTFKVVAGAGPNCDGGTTTILGQWNLPGQSATVPGSAAPYMWQPAVALQIPSSYGVCVQGTATSVTTINGYVGP